MARTVRSVHGGIPAVAVFAASIGSAIGAEPIANGNVITNRSDPGIQATAPGPDSQPTSNEGNTQTTPTVSLTRRLTLRDGSLVEGTLVELSPKVSITLLLPRGEVRTIRWEDVEKQEETSPIDTVKRNATLLPTDVPTQSPTRSIAPQPQSNDSERPITNDRPRKQSTKAKLLVTIGAGFLYSRMLSTSFYSGTLDIKFGLLLSNRLKIAIGLRGTAGQTASGNPIGTISLPVFSIGSRWLRHFYTGALIQVLDLILIKGPYEGFIWPSTTASVDARFQVLERTNGALTLFVQPGFSGTFIEKLRTSDIGSDSTIVPRFSLNLGLGYVW